MCFAAGAPSLRYKIGRAVLKALGELTSARGGKQEAREFDAEATAAPLTAQGMIWVVGVVKTPIRSKGERAADPTAHLPQITPGNFISLGT